MKVFSVFKNGSFFKRNHPTLKTFYARTYNYKLFCSTITILFLDFLISSMFLIFSSFNNAFSFLSNLFSSLTNSNSLRCSSEQFLMSLLESLHFFLGGSLSVDVCIGLCTSAVKLFQEWRDGFAPLSKRFFVPPGGRYMKDRSKCFSHIFVFLVTRKPSSPSCRLINLHHSSLHAGFFGNEKKLSPDNFRSLFLSM